MCFVLQVTTFEVVCMKGEKDGKINVLQEVTILIETESILKCENMKKEIKKALTPRNVQVNQTLANAV